jgi:hypothetical protein
MAQKQKPGSKSQAIREFLAEHPDATPSRIAKALAAQGIELSPAFVTAAQSVQQSKAQSTSEPAINEAFPNLAKWVQSYGWIEIGEREQLGFVARALDDGGLIVEDNRCETLAEATQSLDTALAAWFSKQGMA